MKCLWLFPAIISLMSCSSPTPSELDYSHAPGSQATMSPLGGIKILKSDVNFEQDLYSVCVRSGAKGILDEQLLLETKLAYASWLSSAGIQEDDWNLFSFTLKEACPDNESSLASVVLLNSDKDSDSSELSSFPQSTINCQRQGYSFSCGTRSGTVGQGRWGGAAYSYNPSNGKWISINGFSQIRATFSQHVEWYSLATDIKENPSLDEDKREQLLTLYNELLSTASYDQLIDFQNAIEQERLVSSGDLAFKDLFRDFQDSQQSLLNKTYRSKLGLYHVLLHEVGHNFGMQHSHQEARDGYTSVETPGLKVEQDGKIKFISTMAYSDSYLFLTDDDKLGVQSMRRETDGYFEGKL